MMNNLLHPSRRVSILLIALSIFVLFSCSEDDKPDKTLATIAVPETSLANSHRTWIFLTDDDGVLLGEGRPAHEGVDMIFERPKGFKGNTFTLHLVSYRPVAESNYSDWNVYSYTNVKAGSFSLPEFHIVSTESPIGEATVVVNNVPPVYQPRIIGGGVRGANFTLGGGTASVKTSVFDNDKWMVCHMTAANIEGQVPRYAYFNSVNAGETKTISFLDLPEAKHNTLTFDSEIETVQVTVGLPNGRGIMDFYGVYNTTTAPVYYPEDVTEDFSTSVALYNGNDYRAYFRIGSIPTTMKTLSATIGSLSVTDTEASLTTTGAYDYLMMYSSEVWESEGWEHGLTWGVYMNDEESKQFAIPAFPEAITDAYPELANIPRNFDLISLTETDRHSGYQDFLIEQLKGDKPLTKALTETLVLRKAFAPGGRLADIKERFEIKP